MSGAQQLLAAYGAAAGGGASGTWNPSDKSVNVTLSGGDLIATGSTTAVGSVRGTSGHSSGNRYCEITVTSNVYELLCGLSRTTAPIGGPPGTTTDSWGYYAPTGRKYYNGVLTVYGASYAVGAVIGIQYNAGTLIFWKNGVSQGDAFTGLTGTLYPMWGNAAATSPANVGTLNTGASAFAYSLPSGASAWG